MTPHTKCKLKLLKQERIKDYLLMEEEFIRNQERLKPQEEKNEEERSKVDDLRYIGVGISGVYYSWGKYKAKYEIDPFLLFWTN